MRSVFYRFQTKTAELAACHKRQIVLNPLEEKMKIRFVVALVGLAISFALPTIAQQKDTVDPQLREALAAYNKKEDEAWNNNDAVALAALYTEDAVLVNDTGPIYGRDAIEKHYADVFKQVHFSNHIITADQYSPHIIGTAGNEAWTSGEWTMILKGQNFGPVDAKAIG
jgi:ketosteroid isomerase-like protein